MFALSLTTLLNIFLTLDVNVGSLYEQELFSNA